MKTIDCLFIGYNEMNFAEYESTLREMGSKSGAYRDLNLNFIRWNKRPYTITDMFNLCYEFNNQNKEMIQPFRIGETFNTAIAYLGTYLHRRGFIFDFVNSFQDRKAELEEKLTQNPIISIVIITTLYVSVLPILEIIEFIKKYNQSAKIIVGGPFVSTQFRTQSPSEVEYLFHSTIGADFYINSSQGESTLVKVIDALKNQLSFDEIHNIYYKSGKKYQKTTLVQENNRLSENQVDWQLFSQDIGDFVAIRTAISCPFTCSFCGFPEHAGKYQTTAPGDIEKELLTLTHIKEVKSIHFVDDTFNVPVTRFKEILKGMIKNRFTFHWHSYLRCQYIDRETVELMKASGCEGVYLGIESGNDQILKNMNKAVDTERYLKGIQLLKEYGIVTYGNFIIGFPGETIETVKDTQVFIEKSGIDYFRTQLWFCEPITPIWREKEKYQIKGESFEWEHLTMNTQQACELIENLFFSVKNATWIPQYNFDFDGFWHLAHRNLNLNQVKKFISAFNNGIKEKLREPMGKEVSHEVLQQLKNSLRGTEMKEEIVDNCLLEIDKRESDPLQADFDF